MLSGKVTCCYTNGCNKDIATALGSRQDQDVPSPSQAFKVQPLQQVKYQISVLIFNLLLFS